jgi:uncharacterized glyoxalase superfamily protein PhnB
MNRFHNAVPILSVKNVSASLAYYVGKLGFTKKWDWGDPPSFGCVARGEVQIFLCAEVQGHPGTWMSIFLDHVDALHEEYQRTGAIIHMPPTNMAWGVREMIVGDLDSHRLRMGTGSTNPADPDAFQRIAKIEQMQP